MARVAVEGSVDRLFNLVDEIASQILVAERTGPGESLTQVAAVTTGSIDAFKWFLQGEQRFHSGRFAESVDAFERAVAEDSTRDARVLPPRVQVVFVRPEVTFENSVLLDMQVGAETPADFIELLKVLEESLLQQVPKDEIRPLLEPLLALADDRDFWNHTLDGLQPFDAPQWGIWLNGAVLLLGGAGRAWNGTARQMALVR